MINSFRFLFSKAKQYNLNISTFGKNRKSDINVIKKFSNKEKIRAFFKICNKKIDLEIGDLNIYNVLAQFQF